MLTAEQARAIQLVIDDGKNIAITGGAGVGKSFTIHHLAKAAREKGLVVAVTAATGIAALNIKGTTLHSFLGLGLAKGNVQDLIKLAKKGKVKKRLTSTNLLIIDEMSMVDPVFLAVLDEVLRNVRKSMVKPFGGMRIVLVGDFAQLPPVVTRADMAGRVLHQHQDEAATFVFESPVWKSCVHEVVYLTQVQRQIGDARFFELLNRMRIACNTQEDIEIIRSRVVASLPSFDGIEPTRLYPLRADVGNINATHLQAIEASTVTFKAQVTSVPVSCGTNAFLIKSIQQQLDKAELRLVKSVPVDRELHLKVGAQVMLRHNVDVEGGLANGSRGIVTDYGIDPDSGTQEKVPRVRFVCGKEVLVCRNAWVSKLDGVGTVTFSQIPLDLAWACTIHKSQGLTLDLVEMALDHTVFEFGQAYTALSRARTLANTRITSFDPSCIRAHPKVVAFYGGVCICPTPTPLAPLTSSIHGESFFDDPPADPSFPRLSKKPRKDSS